MQTWGGRERIAPHRDADPDKTIAFVAEMDFEAPEGTVVYTCPMHPAVVSGQPGKCPECGMKLVPTEAAAVFTCPMHPLVVRAAEGKCPVCAMRGLIPVAATVFFTCPMHPDVVSGEQGKCPRCAMKLVRRWPSRAGR